MTNEQLATVLAALRYYQSQGLASNPHRRPDGIHEIATDGDNLTSLDDAGIDALCEELNQ